MKFKSPLFTQASGSIAGMTFSRNRGGMYVRSRATPTNPKTDAQSEARGAMVQLNVQWGALSNAERDAWALYAENTPKTDVLGEPIFMSAQQAFLRTNIPRLRNGHPTIDTAPTTFNFGGFTNPDGTLTGGTLLLQMTFDNADDWANEDESFMYIQAGIPYPQSRKYYGGPWYTAGNIAGSATTPPTSPAGIALREIVASGLVVPVRVRVSRADGRLSSPFVFRVTAS